eukprot:CAMPEP_0184675190 /NCGR_PEP_ID=MMETSP0308-20130426/87652_1 /TAXON_ID=38269 /ORGANISM="Gloeochaete witrockiana, Strain SAG 46.84" /LENGTH=142 /DNA_ID=CAMNT_0027122873 /DNA_START=90 /DNA_END=518 /DNA_ORIENTATION=-
MAFVCGPVFLNQNISVFPSSKICTKRFKATRPLVPKNQSFQSSRTFIFAAVSPSPPMESKKSFQEKHEPTFCDHCGEKCGPHDVCHLIMVDRIMDKLDGAGMIPIGKETKQGMTLCEVCGLKCGWDPCHLMNPANYTDDMSS